MGTSFFLVFDMDISERPTSGYKDFLWAVELNRFTLELIGLWPKTAKEGFSSVIRTSIIFIFLTFVCGIPLVCSLMRVWGDMMLMIDNIQITLPLLVMSLKFGTMWWKRTALLSILEIMAEDWMSSKTRRERDVMIERARTARLIVTIGYVFMISAFVLVIVLPYFGLSLRHLTNLTDPGKPLPLQTYYFYDTDKSPQFELTFITQAATILLAAITFTSVDAFLGLVILHLCGQLENFKGRLATLISYKDFVCVLSNNVVNHLRLIRFVSYIKDTFTVIMLGLIFQFGITFCLYGVLLVTVITEEDELSFPRLCFPLLGITISFMHTFLYCAAGEIITQQCEEVYRAMCELKWYKLETKQARILILLLIRANEPFRIAGRIFPPTMTTFCNLLKTSAGYISVLLARRE